MATRLIIEMDNHDVIVVGLSIEIKTRKPAKGETLTSVTKVYKDNHSVSCIIGRLRGELGAEEFLRALICRFKQDMVRAGKL